jgi:hypothetical protein
VFSIELDAQGATYRFRERDSAERFARSNGLDVPATSTSPPSAP